MSPRKQSEAVSKFEYYLPFRFLFVFVEYYGRHRKPNEEYDSQSTGVDLIVLKLVIHEAATEVNLESFREHFCACVNLKPRYFYDLNAYDDQAELKALFLLVAITLMNVQDHEGDESHELIPFFRDLMNDTVFDSSFTALSALLFNTSDFPVSSISKLYVFALD